MKKYLLKIFGFILSISLGLSLVGSFVFAATIPTPVAFFETTLASGITSSATTFTLVSATTKDGTTLSGTYAFVIDEGTADEEMVSASCTGTACSSATRGLSVVTGNTAVSALAKSHRRGSSIKITDGPQLLIISRIINGQETFPNVLTYASGIGPTNSSDLTDKEYVLSVVSGGAISFEKVVVSATAGETVAAGNLVYFKSSDGRWWKTDGDIATTIHDVIIGVAQGAGTAGSAITGGVLIKGTDANQSGGSGGSFGYVSNTAGSIATSAGTVTRIIGQFKSATEIYIDPNFYNTRFITTDGVSASSTDQVQSTSNTTIEVGEADATSKKNKIAQQFIPAKTKIRGVVLKKKADTGTFTGTVTVALYGDSGSDTPAGVLADVTLTNAQWAAIATDGTPEILFSSEYSSLVIGTKYWINITTSTSDNSNHPNFEYQNTNVYTPGLLKSNNTTDGWTSITGDLYFKTLEGNANQVVKTNSSGEITGFTKKPVITLYTASSTTLGSSTSQFDITNPSGTTFRYTYDGTGTDPGITSTTLPIGSYIQVKSSSMVAANTGNFVTTGVGANYFEVTNASGVVESNKTLANGFLKSQTKQTWTKASNLKYVVVELVGGGGPSPSTGADSNGAPGGGGGGYSKEIIAASSLNATENIYVALAGSTGGGAADVSGGTSAFGSYLSATGGGPGDVVADEGGTGGTATGGDLNVVGDDGGNVDATYSGTEAVQRGGFGGGNLLGGITKGKLPTSAGTAGKLYGGGGSGGSTDNGGSSQNGADGAAGVVIVTEYY